MRHPFVSRYWLISAEGEWVRLHPSVSFNVATGGGIPRRRFTELGGRFSFMKSTWTWMIAAKVIQEGGIVAYFDLENSLDPYYLAKLGIDVKNDPFLWYHRRKEEEVAKGENRFLTAEDHLDGLRELMDLSITTRKKDGFGVDLAIFDSIGAMNMRAQIEGDMNDKHWAVRARLLSQFFDVGSGEVFDSNMAVVFINQVRQNQNANEAKYYPYVMPGGESKNHAMGIQIMLAKPLPLEVGEGKKVQTVGRIMRGTTTKNKTFPEKQKFEVPIRFDADQYAVDTLKEIIDISKELRLLTNKDGEFWKSGHCFYAGVNVGNGFQQVYDNFAGEHADIADELENTIYRMIDEAHVSKNILAPVDQQTLDDIGG